MREASGFSGYNVGMVWEVLGGSIGQWIWVFLARCGSTKKRNPQKISRRSWSLGIWRRLVVVFSGVDVDDVWDRSGVIGVDLGLTVG